MTKTTQRSGRVTIKDIAREAGVDPSTVTRALQGSTRVRESTRHRIKDIAAQLGYVPSAIARSLVAQRSHLVGLVIPDMTNPFFAPLARGIEEEAARHNLRVLIRNTEGNEDAERDAIKVFSELAADAVIVPMARCPQSYYDNVYGNTPIVHVNREGAKHQVSCDTMLGTSMILQHLISLGHERIGFVSGPAGPAREPKSWAYRDAMANLGQSQRDDWQYEFDGTTDSVEIIADAILANPDRPTAVFAWNDVCAIALIHALNKRGLSVPGDISIAGHDDIALAGVIQPPLTTVHWPMLELGIAAVRYAIHLHEGKAAPECEIPAPQLMVRESTAAPGG
ncbi:MAG: LacI family DNA-binding transcriptional regulator [Pseudomonadota bacterium]